MTCQDSFRLPEPALLLTFQSRHYQIQEGGRCSVFKKILNFYLNLPALNHFSFIHSSEASEGLPVFDSALTKISLDIRLDKMMNCI